MRSVFALLALLTLLPGLSQAVDTKRCPKEIEITYQSIRAYSDAELEKAAADAYVEFALPAITSERNSFRDGPPWHYQEVKFKLRQKINSQCRYTNENEERLHGSNETRLFTRGGRDILRVSLKTDTYYYTWTYHTLMYYSTKGLSLGSNTSSRVLGYFDHGSPRVQIGWANDVVVK